MTRHRPLAGLTPAQAAALYVTEKEKRGAGFADVNATPAFRAARQEFDAHVAATSKAGKRRGVKGTAAHLSDRRTRTRGER